MEILDKLCNAPGGTHCLLSFDTLKDCEIYRVKIAKRLGEYPGVTMQRIKTKNHYNIKLGKEK